MSTGILAAEKRQSMDTDELAQLVTGEPDAKDAAACPGWFRQMRAEGWKRFQSLPMPVRTDEAWRFANLKAIDISAYRKPLPVSEVEKADLIERSAGVREAAGRMIFGNDQLLRQEALSDELQRQGVIFVPIEQALIEHEATFRKHFMTQEVVLGSRKFAALHQAWVKSGTFLYVPPNVRVDLPIEVFHWLHGDGGASFPHTLLIADENSEVTLVDYFQSSDANASGFACGVNDLYLEAGAKLRYLAVQDWGRETLSFQINSTIVGRGASATGMNLNLGSAFSRSESVSRLVGEGGRSDMLAVSVADGTQEFDQRTLQDHRAPNTASDLLYKNSLDGQSRTIFAGLIRVERDAQKTDAYQKVRNLLLSDEAEANSMPGLEIMANEVRCTHGATSGQIEEEELFYLLSRGISKQAAQRLIVFGFLNEVILRFGHEAVGEKLGELVQGKFASKGRGSV